jgi:hypothetical protein
MTDCNQVNWGLEVLKVVPTFIVACIAVYIAFRQSKTAEEQREIAKAKLNLDLFTRRLDVFTKTWDAASSVSQSKEFRYAPISMTNLYPEASFLFGSDVEVYMKELARKMNNLASMREQTERNNDFPIPADKNNEILELESWIFNAAAKGIRNTFSPYLNFGQWR